MSRFQDYKSTRFTFEGKVYVADIGSRGDRLSLVSCLPEGIQRGVNEYTSFNVYDEDDVEYFGLWMTGDFLPRLTKTFPEPVMVVRVWNNQEVEL